MTIAHTLVSASPHDVSLGAAERLAGHFAAEQILEHSLRYMFEVVECRVGFASVVDELAGKYDKSVALNIGARPLRGISLREGLTGTVAQSRHALLLDDFEASRLPKQRGTIDSLHATVGVPMIWRDRLVGALFVFSVEPGRRFTRAETEVLRLISAQATASLQNARATSRMLEFAARAAKEQGRMDALEKVHSAIGRQLSVVMPDDERRSVVEAAVVRAVAAVGSGAVDTGAIELPVRVAGECSRAGERTDVRVDLVVRGEPRTFDHATEDAVVQSLRSTLAVLAPREHIERIRVGLVYGEGLTVLIEDDAGRSWCDPELDLVEQAVERWGGRWSIESVSGWSSRIQISFGGKVRSSVTLTEREQQVADKVALGFQDKQIAAALGISVKTVEKHVGSIFRKTGLHNRAMLAAWMGRQSS